MLLVRDGDTLRSRDMQLCGFVPVIGQDGEKVTSLAEDSVRLHHDADQPVDPVALTKALTTAPVESWSSAQVGGEEPFGGVWLRATVSEPLVCRIEVTDTALNAGGHRSAVPIRTPALVEGDSLAYMTLRFGQGRHLLGAAGYGPRGAELARRLTSVVDAWSSARTNVPEMTIRQARADSQGQITKSDSVLTLKSAQ